MITLLLFSLIAQSQAQSNSCPKDMKSKTAAISVGFSYPKSNRIRLRGTRQDAEFYNSQMGSAASDNPKLIEDEHVEGMNKDVFLSQLRNQIKNREFVLFSYAGHGIYNSKGEWAMILPSIPEGLISRCQSALSETKVSRPEVVDPDCEKKLEQYLVTDKDLQSVFKDKKVLMFNDACLAGGMELGKSTVHVAGALSNVRALDGSDDGGGLFTSKVKQLYSLCQQDGNHDGRIDGGELLARLPWSNSETNSKNRKPSPKMNVATTKVVGDSESSYEVALAEKGPEPASGRGIAIERRRADGSFGEVHPEKLNPAQNNQVKIAKELDPNENLIRQRISVQNYQSWVNCFDLGKSACGSSPTSGGRGGEPSDGKR
tara:strand:- start:15384 stop:16502 length:1119 start_codon:yes stop_codon:yes gene_type:complete